MASRTVVSDIAERAIAKVKAFAEAWAEETSTEESPNGTEQIQVARGHGAYPMLRLSNVQALLESHDHLKSECDALREKLDAAIADLAKAASR